MSPPRTLVDRLRRRSILSNLLVAATAYGLCLGMVKSVGDFRAADRAALSRAALPVPPASRQSMPPYPFQPSARMGEVAFMVLALACMVTTGVAVAAAMWGASRGWIERALIAGLAIPIGFGLHSVPIFGLFLGGRLTRGTAIASTVVLTLVGSVAWLCGRRARARVAAARHPGAAEMPAHKFARPNGGTLAPGCDLGPQPVKQLWAIATGVLIVVVCLAGPIRLRPCGDYDALYLWNARAAAMVLGPPDWRWAYGGGVDPAYRDYPLLLPAIVVDGWCWAGEMSFLWPTAVAVTSLISIVLIVVAMSGLLGHPRPMGMGLLFLAVSALYAMTASQYADVPLMSATCGAAAMLELSRRTGCRRHLALALLLAGFAAWTKNEGLPVLAMVAGVALYRAVGQRDGRLAAWAAAGAVVPLAVIVIFKLVVGWANDLWTIPRTTDLTHASVSARAVAILGATVSRLGRDLYWPYAVSLLILAGRWRRLRSSASQGGAGKRGTENSAPLATLGIALGMTATYFAVFMLTPRDLTWHLQHAEKRLLMQVWPLWVMVVAALETARPRL